MTCAVAAVFAASAVRADELPAEHSYRISARQLDLDLVQRTVHAEGDAQLSYDGMSLRAAVLDYHLEQGTGRLTDAAGRAQGVYFAARSLQVTPQQMILTDGSFTTCDEPQPHYRITAQQIILRPGDRIISRHAALWYGRRRLFRLPDYSYSLGRGRATSPVAPIAGYSGRDGAFAGFRYTLDAAGATSADLEARATTSRGVRALARSRSRQPWGELAATLSRREDLTGADLGLFAPNVSLTDVTVDRLPELAISLTPVALGHWASAGAHAAAGRYHEQPSGVREFRGAADLYLQGNPFAVGGAALRPLFGVRGVHYGTGQNRSATAYGAMLDSRPGANLALRLGYLRRRSHGGGPFTFDALDIGHELDLGVAARLGPGWRIQVVARRDLEHDNFPALDAGLIRVSHCLEYGVTYRKVTKEIGLRFGLAQVGPLAAPGW